MIATVTLNPSLDEWMQLPSLRVGRLHRATGFARYPGGKGLNVSRVIHELGGPTVAFGLAGGKDGLILRGLMRHLAIPHEFVEVHGATRNNYKIHTAHPPALTEINTEGPRVSPAVLGALQRRLVSHRPRPSCVALSGSLPPGAPPTTYQRWISALRRLKIPAALDASGAALREGLLARPWLIKPNRQEAEELLGRRLTTTGTLVRAIEWFVHRGSQVVVLSLGREGAALGCASPPGIWFARSPAIHTDSAVGAGDSLVGGFLVGWVKRQSLLEAFRLGAACGTATAMTPSTELCHRADVRRILRRVVIRRLA